MHWTSEIGRQSVGESAPEGHVRQPRLGLRAEDEGPWARGIQRREACVRESSCESEIECEIECECAFELECE